MGNFVLLLPILVSSVFLQSAEGVVQCYVCSWQPSKGFDIGDNCTHYNFKPEYASIVNCTKGCEAVTYRHSKKENITHFSRNCLNSRDGQGSGDTCFNQETKMEYSQICECHSNLCNGSSSQNGKGTKIIFAAIGILMSGILFSKITG